MRRRCSRREGQRSRLLREAWLHLRCVGQTVQVLPAPDVAGVREGAAPGPPLDPARERLTALDLPARDDDVRPRASEPEHHLAAEATAPARHDGDTIGEVEEVLHRCRLVVRASSAAFRAMSSTTSPNAAILGL